ncbi:hypothetical protein BaRGS_00012898, partial [Batillaria attramentaria]
ALPVLLINTLASPFHRGFFCDDQSLMHPFKPDTIPTWLLVVCSMGVPLICILVVECLLQKTTRFCVLVPTEIPTAQKSYVELCYRSVVLFLFGAAITQLMTEIAKYTVGRLRPHFFDVCRPANLPANCSGIFITEDVCTGENDFTMKQARLSFCSGHASMSMYAATFVLIYLQARLTCSQAKLVRPVLQVTVFCLALYTCFTRISDYKHHWSDVLGGAILGIVFSMGDFHQTLLRRRPLLASNSRKERLPMYRQNNTSSSSDIPSESQETIQVHIEPNPK